MTDRRIAAQEKRHATCPHSVRICAPGPLRSHECEHVCGGGRVNEMLVRSKHPAAEQANGGCQSVRRLPSPDRATGYEALETTKPWSLGALETPSTAVRPWHRRATSYGIFAPVPVRSSDTIALRLWKRVNKNSMTRSKKDTKQIRPVALHHHARGRWAIAGCHNRATATSTPHARHRLRGPHIASSRAGRFNRMPLPVDIIRQQRAQAHRQQQEKTGTKRAVHDLYGL